MEEPKNLNNPPTSQPAETAAPKNIPTIAGVMIVLSVAVIVGAGIVYFFQTDFSDSTYNSPVVVSQPLKSKTETADTKTEETVSQTQTPVAEEVAKPAVGTTFDFNYELKKLDDQNNSISADDFNETEMSDANIGL